MDERPGGGCSAGEGQDGFLVTVLPQRWSLSLGGAQQSPHPALHTPSPHPLSLQEPSGRPRPCGLGQGSLSPGLEAGTSAAPPVTELQRGSNETVHREGAERFSNFAHTQLLSGRARVGAEAGSFQSELRPRCTLLQRPPPGRSHHSHDPVHTVHTGPTCPEWWP